MKNDEVFSRLQNLINYIPTQKEIRIKTGINQSTLSTKKSRNSNWNDDDIQKLNDAYHIDIYKEQSIADNCINIPIHNEVEASMGYGVEVYNEQQTGFYSISCQLAKDLGINKDDSEIIYGRGNSMEPTILGGDALLIDRSKTEMSDGRIYCIRYDGQLLVKRLQKISRDKVRIISDNKDYEAITIDINLNSDIDFQVIGEVRWSGRIFK